MNTLIPLVVLLGNQEYMNILLHIFARIIVFCSFTCHLQIGDLKGLFGLLMVSMQTLRQKTKVLDKSYGVGTGRLGFLWMGIKLRRCHFTYQASS